jgi:hypothetical protein
MTVPRSLRYAIALASLLAAASAQAQRLPSVPRLHAGETLVYQLDLSGSRSTKVESQVTTPESPPWEDLTAQCLLQVNVAEVNARGFRVKTYLSDRNVVLSSGASSSGRASSPDKLVEVFIALDGTASETKGFTDLTVAQQHAWNAWLNRFTSSMTFPKSGVRQGQRWKILENESSPSPIADLAWERKYEYVKQQNCGSQGQSTPAGTHGNPLSVADTCAVIFVRAQLKQKSSPKNATPQDYKLRGLATAGTATGTNETILYISTRTGLLVRSTEDVKQTMDATVAVANGSNSVRYVVNAKNRSQIELLPDVPPDVH